MMMRHRQHQRRELSGVMKRALVSGTAASLVSTAALAALARFESKGAAQPVNSTSHVYWGEEAADVSNIDLRHSVPGYLIHHASSIFWAMFFESITSKREYSPGKLARNAAAVAATAVLLDY